MCKRLFDIFLASLLLIALAPVMAITWWLIRKHLGKPAIFTQDRPGKAGQIYRLYKFRTMTDSTGPDGLPLADEQRLTPIGAKIRTLSLDELPQIFNVLKGDMSFVGPRPLLVRYLPRYTSYQARRHEVRPGITGWAQVNGRNALSWEQKFECDVWYVDHASFWLDLKILALTVQKVFQRHGINADGQATASEFFGTSATPLPTATPPESFQNSTTEC